MEAIVASTEPLVDVAKDSHAQPDALGRIYRVMGGAMAACVSNPTFADWFKGTLDNLADTLDNVTRKVDNLTARLQAMRCPVRRRGSCSGVSPAAKLAGLHGNDLFRKLMTLQLPAAAPAEFFLEAAIAAQSLIVHDQLDIIIDICEKIIFKSDTTEIKEYNFMTFKHYRQTLEKFVQEHIDLADAAATSSPPTNPAK